MTGAWGAVSGRVTSLAFDPSDATGNTLYLGSSGGGVWRSTNAAASTASAVTFQPLTDGVPYYIGQTPVSLSIGAVSVQPGGTGVILAGTGDPNDALDSYWGSGILRSADGGNTWTIISGSNESFHTPYVSRQFMGEAAAAFAWSSTSPNTAVAALGASAEAADMNAVSQYSQPGLYYSTDAGATWYLATVQDDVAGTQIVQSPAQSPGGGVVPTAAVWNPVRQRFYAAIRYHGYYESADGITWIRLANQPGASLSAAQCPPASSQSCPVYRGALAVQPATGDMFAITVDSNNLDQGVWQDQCALRSGACSSATVAFAQQLPSAALEAGGGSTAISQGNYDLWLAAVPAANDTILYAGTEDIYRCSLSAGCVWRNTTNVNGCAAARVAPNQHAVSVFTGSGQPLLYFGNDGGLWRSTDNVAQTAAACSADDAAHFSNMNGAIGSLAEVVDVASDPVDGSVSLAAQGEFGTSAVADAAQIGGSWSQVLNGAGSRVAIDPNNAQNWYAADASGVSIHYCPAGPQCDAAGFGQTLIGSTQVGGDGDALSQPAPWMLDPQDSTQVLIGTCRVWRGPAQSGAWTGANAISPMLDGNNQPMCNSNGVIRSLAASGAVSNLPGGQELIYAGMAGTLDGGAAAAGRLFRAAVGSGTPQWIDLSKSPVTNDNGYNQGQFNPGGFAISGIAVDPHDTTGQTAYVTIPGFSGNGISAPLLYGSTDGGAHWSNITSSLPTVPANDVIVDPTNANIIYVATDDGVYVTQQVSSCYNAGSGCFSSYGTGLPGTPVTRLNIFHAGETAYLRAATYGRGVWQIPLASQLSTETTLTLAPPSVSFGSQALQAASKFISITVTNTGSQPLNVSQVTATGDFSQNNNCATPVAAGSTCTVNVSFTPSQLGARAGVLTVYANISGGQAAAALSGTGVPGTAVVLLPDSLSFGGVAVGSTSSAQSVTISNTGGVPINLNTPTVSSGFAITNGTCGSSLPANTGCTVSVAFAPTSPGLATGALTVTDDSGTQTVPLSGTGLSAATDTLSPLSLTFAPQLLNTPSAAQGVTLTNAGDASLSITGVQATGDFTVANSCGSNLIGHASCTLNVSYLPEITGPETGTLVVADALRTQTVALSGSGIAEATHTLSPTSLAFAPQPLNTRSVEQTVTLTNSGDGVLTSIAAQISGDFALGAVCGRTLQPHSSCTFSVSYLPAQLGPETGTLTITDAIGPQTVPLSGTGVAGTGLQISPSSLSFATTAVGAVSQPQLLALTNAGATSLSGLAVSVTGDFSLAASTCSDTLAPGAGCALSVTFAPSAAGSRAGAVTVNAAGLPGSLIVELAGSGADFQMTLTGSGTATIASGQSVLYTVQILPAAGSGETLSLSCSGAPQNATCSLNPTAVTLTPGVTQPVTVTVATGVSTLAAIAPPRPWLRLRGMILALLLPLCVTGGRRLRRLRGLAVVVAALVLVWGVQGCSAGASGGSSPPPPPPPPDQHITPSGSYTLTITAQDANLKQSVNLTLVVE